MSAQGDSTWVSAHLYFDGKLYGAEGDAVIGVAVDSFACPHGGSGRPDRFFFVRYSDSGPHIRLRLRMSAKSLRGALEPDLLERAATLVGRALTDAGQRVQSQPPKVRLVEYEREVERYGGLQAMAVAEDVFHASSVAAIEMLGSSPWLQRPSRLGRALLAMLIAGRAAFRDRHAVAAFMDSYHCNYLTMLTRTSEHRASLQSAFRAGFDRQAEQVQEYTNFAWSEVSSSRLEGASLGYARALDAAVGRLRELARASAVRRAGAVLSATSALETIVPSYVHMMNNRLGVTIAEESYLAHIVARALDGRGPSPTPALSTGGIA